jgi:translation initiation factor IF-3
LRVVDDEGKNLGLLARDEALKAAQEQGLDLVLINALSNPPIAKITSFDRFRYQQEKEQKKQQAAHKGGELKQVRITVRAAENDLKRQAQKADEFLEEGHKVEIMMALRGREKSAQMRGWVQEKLQTFLSMITQEYRITSGPQPGGRGMLVQIVKK